MMRLFTARLPSFAAADSGHTSDIAPSSPVVHPKLSVEKSPRLQPWVFGQPNARIPSETKKTPNLQARPAGTGEANRTFRHGLRG